MLISEWDQEDLRRWYDLHERERVAPGLRPLGAPATDTIPDLEPEGSLLVTDYPSLLREVGRIRIHGYATVDEEFAMGVVGASAPVHDFRNGIVAAINVSAPKARVGKHLDEVGALMWRISLDLSALLGSTR
ncbi:IclR family transcriptional regulator domain-containing protein [Pengzhenrongella sp.]|uniref:IclR family transcriptional regulator domain-containing protein n=1 Tax=Pengzhenrongella sp. TaxID=2888820 RepID=UPI002F91E530